MTPPNSTSRRTFILQLSAVSAAVATGAALTGCGGSEREVRFDFGVASGDPGTDRVILWTHARYDGLDAPVELIWEVAQDPSFSPVLASGSVVASATTGYTAKADATGLPAGRELHYRFRAGSFKSAVGRTRTLPVGALAELRLAVMSCTNYPAGFFNVYAEAARSDAQYLVHLGDYIYEYAAGGYASQRAAALGRVSEPANELLTLEDYRRRHAQYKSDPDAKTLHATMPLIAVWDDHEIANDTWREGAENHTEATEGSFAARRAAALQAYHEWMPIRTGADRGRIYRSFDFGDLVSLHMLDTRLLGRDRQIGFGDLLNPATAAAAQATLASPTRQMLGTEQLTWLQGRLTASAARWQVLGQQVLMARMEAPVSVLSALNPQNTSPAAVAAGQAAITAYLTARAKQAAGAPLTAQETALLDPRLNPRLGYNLDAWDGYPVAREVLLSTVAQLRKRLVVLAGDTHNAWHSDLTLRNGVKVGEEFATSSVSSPGLEDYLAAVPPAQVKQIFENVVDDLQWMDPSRRGFLKMTFTPGEARGQWVFIDRIDTRSYSVSGTETRSYRPV
jgi:alkaline phosphatase D